VIAESLGKQIGVAVGTKHQAQIEHVEHNQFARHDISIREPDPHLGQVVGDGEVSGARHDNAFQAAAFWPPSPSMAYIA
jgi:hypothetical protein